jgi:hypothetical protein
MTFADDMTDTYWAGAAGVPYLARFTNDGTLDTEEWVRAAPTMAWTLGSTDGEKTVLGQVMDLAGLVSDLLTDGIKLDATPPNGTIAIQAGTEWTALTDVDLQLTFEDAYSGVDAIRLSNDGVWDDEEWRTPATGVEWTLPPFSGVQTVHLQVRDAAGGVSETFSDDIGLDMSDPSGSITIAGDSDVITSSEVTLLLTFQDNDSGVDAIILSNDEDYWDPEGWREPAETVTWTLAPGSGSRFVYYRVRDNVGHRSSAYDDSVVVDLEPPTGSIRLPDGATTATSTSVRFEITLEDNTSGVAKVRYGNDGTWDDEEWRDVPPSTVWEVSPGDGPKTVYYQVMDLAGWVSETYVVTFILDTVAPTVVATTPANDATSVARGTDIVVRFSEPMDTVSTEASLSVSWQDGEGVVHQVSGTLTWSEDGQNLTLSPSEDLVAGREHQLVVGQGATDVAGNALFPAVQYSFSTGEGGDGGDDGDGDSLTEIYPLLVIIILLLLVAFLLMRGRGRD